MIVIASIGLVLGVAATVAAIVSAIFASRAVGVASLVHHEVRTMNELTIGQLGEAEETRRILAKKPTDRTSRESRHTDASMERSTGA
jgi:hypothetical protein